MTRKPRLNSCQRHALTVAVLTSSSFLCRTTIDDGLQGNGGGLSSGVKAAIIVPSVLLGVALCLIGGAPSLAVGATPPGSSVSVCIPRCAVEQVLGLRSFALT